jgi:hypothetical protein
MSTRRIRHVLVGLWVGGVTEDLAQGVRRSQVLELAVPPAALAASSFDVPAVDTTKIVSARAYDTGLCSEYQPWAEFGTRMIEGLYQALTSAQFLTGSGRTVSYFGGARLRPSTLTPSLRARGITSDEDSVAVRLVFTADRFSGPNPVTGGTSSCTGLDFEVDLDFGFRRVDGIYDLPPRCLGSEPGLTGPAAGTYDFVGGLRQPPRVVARRRPGSLGCDAGLSLSRTPSVGQASVPLELESALARDLPEAVRRTVLDALLVPALAFDLTPRRCTCDIECTALAQSPFGPISNPYGEGSGPRHRCISRGFGRRTCGVQLEADRIALRPDGVEIVLAEDDTDPQYATVLARARLDETRRLCAFGRTLDSRRRAPDFVAPEDVVMRYDLPVVTVGASP